MRRALRMAGLLVVTGIAIGCGGAATTPSSGAPTSRSPDSSAPSVPPTADLANPVGIIAIGHSGLTGEGTGDLFQARKSASWATGDDPAVNSIYLRMVEAIPGTEGHVANAARGGAPASELLSQAGTALETVPAPALAIVQTVDNDITCDAANVADVGEDLAAALDAIHEASPTTKILVVGQPGRPSVDFVTALVAAHPSVKVNLTWDDACTFYTSDGAINPSGFENLTAAIDAYEAETARVCGLVENCFTDGGVRRTWVDRIEYFASDFAHYNLAGQAAEAEQLWPVVEEILGL